jgi:hypothetical protein
MIVSVCEIISDVFADLSLGFKEKLRTQPVNEVVAKGQ